MYDLIFMFMIISFVVNTLLLGIIFVFVIENTGHLRKLSKK